MESRTPLFLLIFVALLSGCVTESLTGQTSPLSKKMDANRKISMAEGHLTVSTTNFNSSLIELSVKKMSRPNKINPRAKIYVVWEVPSDVKMKAQSIGILIPDKNSSASLKTATPFKQFDIFITAEANNNPGAPTGQKLLWTSVSR